MENITLDAEHILKEYDYREYLAPKWKRFLNFIIDAYLVQIIFGVIIGGLAVLFDQEYIIENELWLNVAGILFMLLHYFLAELLLGKTLGKLITGTKVISLEERKPTTKQILYRTFSRIVPFEPFSLLFGYNAWHDEWTETAVVNNSFPHE